MFFKSLRKIALFFVVFGLPVLIIGFWVWQKWGGFWFFEVSRQTSPVLEKVGLAPEKLPWLHTEGRWIVDEQGKKVVLRGVNIGSINWGVEAWNPKATVYAIKNWKAQVVRTRIFQEEFEKDPRRFFYKMEREVIGPARENGAYVILHPWLYNNQPLPDKGTVEMWQAIAEEYKDDPTIIYDILAEPHDVSWQAVYQANIALIEAIRAVHPRALIMATGLYWGREINSYLENPLLYENIVYRSNPYNRAGEFEGLFGLIAQEKPVFLGEFGADGIPPKTIESVKALLEYAEKMQIGWTAWNFSSGGCPCLLLEEERFLPSEYGKVIKSALEEHVSKTGVTSDFPEVFLEKDPPGVFQIYSDYLHHGFVDFSWDVKVDLVSSEQVLASEKSVKTNFGEAGSGFYLHTSLPVDMGRYGVLSFWIRPEKGILPLLRVYFKDKRENLSEKLWVADYNVENRSDWFKVAVPLENFGMVEEMVGLFIVSEENVPISNLYIDEIRLEENIL